MPRCRITAFPRPWNPTVREASGQSRAHRTSSSFSPFWCSPEGPHRLGGSALHLQLLDCRKEQIGQAIYIARGRGAHRWTVMSCKLISDMVGFGMVYGEKGGCEGRKERWCTWVVELPRGKRVPRSSVGQLAAQPLRRGKTLQAFVAAGSKHCFFS